MSRMAEFNTHGLRTVALMLGAFFAVVLFMTAAEAVANKIFGRPVVDELIIKDGAHESGQYCFNGSMNKNRSCPLATEKAEDSVDFYHDAGSQLARLEYRFSRPGGPSRPAGKTVITRWCITPPPNMSSDITVLGFATHKCGKRTVGPHEFARFVIPFKGRD